MKDYHKNKESPYLQYCDVNNLYEWEISQKLPLNNFQWIKDTSKLNKDFVKSYNEESNEGYFLEVDVQCTEKLHNLHNHLTFLPERMKIEKVEKVVTNLNDKTENVIHIRNLKRFKTKHGLVLQQVLKVIKLNENAWLKSYIEMNTNLKKKQQNAFQKNKTKKKNINLMNTAVFQKTIENIGKRRDIKPVATEKRKQYLVSELDYHTTKFFTVYQLAIEMKKKKNRCL